MVLLLSLLKKLEPSGESPPTKVLVWSCLKIWRLGGFTKEFSILFLKRKRSLRQTTSSTQFTKHRTLQFEVKFNMIKRKCLSGINERWLHTMELFHGRQDRKLRRILTKDLYGVEARVSSQGWRELSSKRVVDTSRSD